MRPAAVLGFALGVVLALAAPGAVAWLVFGAVVIGALAWSAREMRPAPHQRKLAGRMPR